ncbi:hypothetical protein RJZ56_002638 [Blastomyces dermatitidis]|uniref:MFS transporter n=1 Tax=Ajellomyces dermatitidis (strain ER-3 / ATCC MYA-2586) TaxID=559297 RepID=A0ABP2EVH3_AJEDR|nr:MFS transporter [Blastomyces dermatitidis ER-3]EEQ87977.2 MFS transporter [Blastomyces dermatitidis ER-3]
MAANPLAHSDLVPSTICLVDVAGDAQNEQYDQDGKDIMFIPRPSSDPEDPLNWSRKWKFTQIAMVYIHTLRVGIPTTVQYSVLTDITWYTGISTGELLTGTGLMFLFLGWGCLIWQPLALTYGR